MNKKIIRTNEDVCNDQSIESLQRTIKHLEETYPDAHNFTIEAEIEHGQYDSSSYPRLFINYSRLETDKEFEYRVEQETKWKEVTEERERQQYEVLKKKFG